MINEAVVEISNDLNVDVDKDDIERLLEMVLKN